MVRFHRHALAVCWAVSALTAAACGSKSPTSPASPATDTITIMGASRLSAAQIDPRFDLVVPKGRAPTWNQMGNGNWATAPTYATGILTLYGEALAFHGLH